MVSLVPGEKFQLDVKDGALNFYQFGKNLL